MNDTEIRSRLRKAMGDYDYKPRSSQEVEAGLVRGAPSSRLGPMGMVAAILAVVIVVSLVYVRVHSSHPTLPAASPSPSSSIPASLLEQMNLGAAAALVTQPNLVGTIGDRTVTFVGAYADVLHAALIFRVSPASDTPLGIDVWWTGYGRDDPYSRALTVGPDGYQYGGDSAHSPAGTAQIRVTLWDNWTYPGVYAASEVRPPSWTFTYNLTVHAATALPVQHGVIQVGSWKVTVLEFEMTPSSIDFHALIDGPPPLGKSTDGTMIAVKSIAIFDEAGGAVSTGCGGGWGASRGYGRVWEVYCGWPRPAQATTYRLVITGGGGQYSTSFDIPAPPTN